MTVVPALKRFDTYVYKPAPSGAIEPAEAVLDFYAQGATVQVGNTIDFMPPNEGDVTVWHPGSLAEEDDVQVGTDASKVLFVKTIAPSATDPTAVITLRNDTSAPITIAPGDRLVRLDGRPEVYLDPMGLVSAGTNALATDPYTPPETPTGRARCYVAEYRYDIIITVTGAVEKRLFVDADGSYVMRT